MPANLTTDSLIALLRECKPEASERAQPHATTDLWKENLLDSFSIVHFISLLEERLGIVFDFTDLNAKTFRSPTTILALLKTKYALT